MLEDELLESHDNHEFKPSLELVVRLLLTQLELRRSLATWTGCRQIGTNRRYKADALVGDPVWEILQGRVDKIDSILEYTQNHLEAAIAVYNRARPGDPYYCHRVPDADKIMRVLEKFWH